MLVGERPKALVRPGWKGSAVCLVAILLLLAGCVSRTRFEEVQSAAAVQGEAYRRSEHRVSELESQVEGLSVRLEESERKAASREVELAQSSLDFQVTSKERDQQRLLVDKLRGELGRTGEYLHVYSRENAELERELAELESRAGTLHGVDQRLSHVANLVRDLTLLEAPALEKGEVSLLVERARPGLLIRAADLDVADRSSLSDSGQLLVVTLTEVARRYPAAAFLITLPGQADESADRTGERLAAAIVEAGVAPARVVFEKYAKTTEDLARGITGDHILLTVILEEDSPNNLSVPLPPAR